MTTKDMEHSIGDVMALSDGQIALSARNEGDGTWSVRLGPGGPILEDGLPRERALAIVGGASYPYEPVRKAEVEPAEKRAELEEAARDFANADALKSDKDLGIVDAHGRKTLADEPEDVRVSGARKSARNTENARERNGEGPSAGAKA